MVRATFDSRTDQPAELRISDWTELGSLVLRIAQQSWAAHLAGAAAEPPAPRRADDLHPTKSNRL